MRAAVGLAALVVLLAGCSVDATVSISVEEDGSGAVEVKVALDPAAVAAADAGGGSLEGRVRLGDLEAAGWTVGPWQRAEDGSAAVEMRKPFTSVDEIPEIIGEINGADGPLRDVQASRDRGLLGTDYRVSGRVDLGGAATGISGDAALAQALAANHVDVNALDQYLLGLVHDAVSVEVVVRLPGGVVRRAQASGEDVVTWSAEASVRNTRRIVFVIAMVALAILAVTLWFAGHPRRTSGVS